MIFKSDPGPGDLNGFIDRGSHLQGELRFETTFRVDGKLTGTVESAGTLVVGSNGEIEGELRVGEALVSGLVKGKIVAQRRIQIATGGRVYAELSTPALVIEDGAFFEGPCVMTRASNTPQNKSENKPERKTETAIKP